ncbi:MAG: TonB-dependent receptor [Sphingobacteriales bacterium]
MLKFILFLVIATSLQAFSKGYGQDKINVNFQNVPLKKALKEIEKKSDYHFLYNDDLLIRNNLPATLNVKDASLDEVMNALLNKTNLGYTLSSNNLVILSEKGGVVSAVTVTGKVTDESNQPIPGVSVKIKGTTLGVKTDVNGKYALNIPDSKANNVVLVFTFVGFDTQEIAVDGKIVINVKLKTKESSLSEVAIVAYGSQKKTTMVSSITSIDPKELKGPTSNLTTMLAGQIAGIVSYQRSGEPGKDNAAFFIRGIGAQNSTPLILIDGIESSSTDLARLQPDDISGFSILKDATATSLYGARGANGVILINTKTGAAGTTKLNFRIENSTSANTQNIGLADNITYMTLANEAVLTRNPLGVLPYSQNKIDHTANGDNPLLYPSNNWIQSLIKDQTNNQRINLNASGGGDKAKFYIAGTYNLDNGNLKENSLNGFSNNIKLQSYSLLSNITLNLTKTTEVLVSLKGQFDDYNGPIGGGTAVYHNALWSNPVMFPAVYPASLLPFETHPLFGNSLVPNDGTAMYENPYAQSLSGFQTENTSTIIAQLSLKQNLEAITPGLSARMMAYTTRYADFQFSRSISPFYYQANSLNGAFTGLSLINTGETGAPGVMGTRYLSFNPGSSTTNATTYGEAALNYSRVFNNKHAIGALLIGTIRNYLTGNASDLQSSLPARNEGVSGRFTYGYDSRYLVEGNFGYNGSERFAANHRFGFFPSVGAGWIVSNENFFKPLHNIINQLKFRVTYGLAGNDQIGNANQRFFYLSNVNLNGGSTGSFGTLFNYSYPTVSTSQYENQDITWELTKQTNIGMDLTLFRDLEIKVDVYQKYVSNILLSGNATTNVPSSMGLQADIQSNIGRNYGKGAEIALNYHKSFDNSLWIQTRGTFTYQVSKVLANIDPTYPANDQNLSRIGNSADQIYGLVAERLFIDNQEVKNSPQQFGTVLAGDIKYRDINGDGKIDGNDMVPIGFPTTPEILYGFGFSVGYKNFDVSAFFQGSARSSFLINSNDITPFYQNGGYQNGLLQVIANNHWSESNQNSYAFWPRLDPVINSNNSQSSTWWLENGSFLRLKSTEIGYNVPVPLLKKLGLRSGRIYVNGTNLLTWSVFKLWDPEMGASGLGYPVQKVFNVGTSIGF